jgi:hypothetical protein
MIASRVAMLRLRELSAGLSYTLIATRPPAAAHDATWTAENLQGGARRVQRGGVGDRPPGPPPRACVPGARPRARRAARGAGGVRGQQPAALGPPPGRARAALGALRAAGRPPGTWGGAGAPQARRASPGR